MPTRESLVEVTAYGDADSQAVNNVFTIMADSSGPAPPAPSSLEDYAGMVLNRMTLSVAPLVSNEYLLRRVVAKTIVSLVPRVIGGRVFLKRVYGEQFDLNLVTPVQGGRAGDSTPTYVSVNVRLKTQRAGRSFRGFKRFGPLAETDTVVNTIVPAQWSAWETAMVQLRTSFPTITIPGFGLQMGIFGAMAAYRAGVLTEPFRLYFAPNTSVSTAIFVGSQVSRKRKNADFA